MDNRIIEPAKPVREKVIESAVGEIHMPGSKIPLDLNINFSPNAPAQIDANEGYGVSSVEKGNQTPKPGFWKTAGAEFYDWNASAQGVHYGYEKYQQPDPLLDIPPSDWTPKTNPEMFYDVKPQYIQYLLEAHGPQDLQYRRDRVMSEQAHDDTLEDGSMFAKVIGGFGGAILDPINLIPIVGELKYARFAPTILKNAARAFPGLAAAATLQSGARQLDRVNGNLSDFVRDAVINSVFGSALFGGFKAGALALDKMELWNLRKLATPGIDYKMALGPKGEITGITAFDIKGGLSAQEVSYAQEIANSSFLKSGFFKIPYAGSALLALKGAPVIGSPLIAMINSAYKVERAFIDRAADHSFYRTGIEKGEASPKSFEHFMKREHAELRGIASQLNALHLERNGFKDRIAPVNAISQIGMGLYNQKLKLLQQDIDKVGYISRDTFNDEIQRVITTKEPSEHAAVNEAASIVDKKIDKTMKGYLKAHNLPEDYFGDPKTARGYLMRVYDINYLNVNKDKWVNTISQYLRDSDELIAQRMEPIRSLEQQIESLKSSHEALIKRPKFSDREVKTSSDALEKARRDLTIAQEKLQNELRTNPDLRLHIEDHHALSADEAKELQKILKPLDDLKKQVSEQQKVVNELKNQKSKSKQSAMKGKTAETAKKHAVDEKHMVAKVEEAEAKLHELKGKVEEKDYELYQAKRNGDINPRLYNPLTHEFRNPNERLRFRETYGNDIMREGHAKAYYDSIMHTNPEDTVADVMGKMMGGAGENPLKRRTLMVPDELLYNNNFLTKDIMSKLNNYSLYLSRRTHIKNVFQDVTHDGGIEPLIEKLNLEYQSKREPFDTRKREINEKLESLDPTKDAAEIKALKKETESLNKKINEETKSFNKSKDRMNLSYERMMGLRKRDKWEIMTQGVIRSLVAMANLHLLPVTQIADNGAIGLQHGMWPYIRDGVYPIVTSLSGLLKTKDSEAIREVCPHIHLGLQDVLNGHADKNISMETQPYVNMGPWVAGAEKMAHFSGNADLTNYIDNWLQRLTGSIVQSKFMKNLHSHVNGTISKNDTAYLLKYGIDPKIWGDRMVKAFQESDGHVTKLGGYQSMFWKWQDMEAANEFSSAVFRAIQNTIVQRGMFDSPFWADNALGMIFHTFTGWGYASVNRYLIPMMQRPDAEQILGVMFALGCGSLVSPMRRMSRGEDAYPEDMTTGQHFYEAVADSAVSSALANVLSYANWLSDDRLMGDLKNDKFRNRTGIGASSAVFGTANRLWNFTSALATGEMNQKDAKDMAHMLPIAGSLYGRQMSDFIVDKMVAAPNRRAAHAE